MDTKSRKKVWNEYIKYLIPTVVGMITYSLYCLADVMFVSWGVGKEGLAALNIALPIFTLYSSLAILIGVGASVTMNICKGQAKQHEANQVFTMALLLMTILGIILTFVSVLFQKEIAQILGANEKILDKVIIYLKPIYYAILLYMFTGTMIVIVRGDGNPKLVMIAGMTGNVLNIFLDYIFVIEWNMGIFGAGFATVIGFSTSAFLLMLHFIKRKNTVHLTRSFLDIKLGIRMLKNGVGASILEISVGVSIFLINLALMKVSGDTSVAIFNVISNIAFIKKGLFGGMAQASQPIISMNYGLKKVDYITLVRKYAMYMAGISGILIFIVLTCIGDQLIGALVSWDEEVVIAGQKAISIYFIGSAFNGLNTVLMYYFQSIESAMDAILLAFMRGIVFVFILLLCLSHIGVLGVWMVMPLSEILAFTCFIIIDKVWVSKRLKAIQNSSEQEQIIPVIG